MLRPAQSLLRLCAGIVGHMMAFLDAGLARAQTSQTPVHVVFFPPTPPVLGAPIPDRAAGRILLSRGRRLVAPAGLEDFVGDYCYPALSTRLFEGELSGRLWTQLHEHRSRRLREVTVLLDEWMRLFNEPPAVVESALRALAAKQTPHLITLEEEGERLRARLVQDGWLDRFDWNAERRWKLDPRKEHPDAVEAEARFQVARAAAYYQKGLLIQQRGLLCELAMDLQQEARRARALPATRDGDAIFFTPETARFRLPAGASAELRAKLAAFHARKEALKRELLDALIAHDRARAGPRTEALDTLADRQWPEIVAIEQLAEELRPELVGLLDLKQPPAPPWLPAGLMDFIREYERGREEFILDLKMAGDAAAEAVPKPLATDGEDEQVRYAAKKAEAQREAMRAYQREHMQRFQKLEQSYKSIVETLKIVAEKQKDPKTGRALTGETLLRQHAASLAEFDTYGRESTIYTHYRLAMLQPGLSPAQRRLLFSYALAGLAQPLPNVELMPTRQAMRPYPAP